MVFIPCDFQLHSTQSPKDSLGEGSFEWGVMLQLLELHQLRICLSQLRLACSMAASRFPSVVAGFCQENKEWDARFVFWETWCAKVDGSFQSSHQPACTASCAMLLAQRGAFGGWGSKRAWSRDKKLVWDKSHVWGWSMASAAGTSWGSGSREQSWACKDFEILFAHRVTLKAGGGENQT